MHSIPMSVKSGFWGSFFSHSVSFSSENYFQWDFPKIKQKSIEFALVQLAYHLLKWCEVKWKSSIILHLIKIIILRTFRTFNRSVRKSVGPRIYDQFVKCGKSFALNRSFVNNDVCIQYIVGLMIKRNTIVNSKQFCHFGY